MRDRWLTLAARFSGTSARDAAGAIFDDLHARYTAPDRHYHDLRHIAACLDLLDASRAIAHEPDNIELAIWFHDAVYETRGRDNEGASAQLADAALQRLGIASPIRRHVADLILATRHDRVPADPDAALLVDIDLAILGQPVGIFDAYEAAIRREYAWVPDADFRVGRSKVLRAFLARPHIYATAHYQNLFEQPARDNLVRSLAALNA
jgi:predicted metal-dependent HD superfamily phosphohydrolase